MKLTQFTLLFKCSPQNTIKSIAAQAINTPAIVIFSLFLAIFISFNASAKENIADVAVKDAWVRTSVPGQQASGAFMTLTSKTDLQLVGVSSPVAGVAEVHEMKMNGDMMQMRAVPSLDLPAGKAVALRPGSFHVMLMDLKAALPKDSTVPLTLLFKDAKGLQSQLQVTVPVRVTAP
jgi:periplasmic copper chaperone A